MKGRGVCVCVRARGCMCVCLVNRSMFDIYWRGMWFPLSPLTLFSLGVHSDLPGFPTCVSQFLPQNSGVSTDLSPLAVPAPQPWVKTAYMYTHVRLALANDGTITWDAWLALLKAAHWHADIEQVVRTGEDAYHRADITAASPEGTLWALDVSITATPGPEGTVHEHLECSANAKASQCRPGGERRLPDGHTLVPLIHSADLGWFNIETMNLLQRLMSRLSVVDATPGVEDGQPLLATVTQLQLAKISQAMHLAHWQMHTACGRLL